MKKLLLAGTLFFLSAQNQISAQKILNDKAIVSQHKRQVFEKWGDWRPYGKYLFGIQTNFAYATVWGWMAPSKNKKYKNGPDIRPLKPTGLEVQRNLLLNEEKKKAEEIEEKALELKKDNVKDFLHWNNMTTDSDPLWLLYYKKMLKPLKEFPENPSNYIQWGFTNEKVYNRLQSTGRLKKLKEDLDLLKHNYYVSKNVPMPRGKRILLYHETLIKWRKFYDVLNYSNHEATVVEEFIQKEKEKNINVQQNSDINIINSVMERYKHKF